MLDFELLELVHESVKGSVGNFWIVYDVIEVLVTLNFFAQALDFSSGVTAFRHGNLDSGMWAVKTPVYYTMRPCSKNPGTAPCQTELTTRCSSTTRQAVANATDVSSKSSRQPS